MTPSIQPDQVTPPDTSPAGAGVAVFTLWEPWATLCVHRHHSLAPDGRLLAPPPDTPAVKTIETRSPVKGQGAGRVETLYGRLTRPGSRSIPIPVRMGNGAPGTRSCTADFKIAVIGRELRRRGATPDNPATVALGISVDELERAHPGVDARARYQQRTYPLLDLGLTRTGCARVITAAGLAVPPKSACWFCPFHDLETWRRLKRHTPELFQRACELEDLLNQRRRALGRDRVWLTRWARPLAQVIDDQLVLPGLDTCDSGWCMT